MSVMRQRISEHMVLPKRVSPHVYTFDDADTARIARVREAARAGFEQKHQMKLPFYALFRACLRGCVARLSQRSTLQWRERMCSFTARSTSASPWRSIGG